MTTTTAPLWTPAAAEPTSRIKRALTGAADDPRWVRPSVITLLVGTAVLYLADLGASGYGNDFYAAAVQAGTKSWKAFFFGSFDSSNFITVDKPPASLWVMELSGRIFGFSSWSMLAPQALEGVLAVGLTYAAVRRWFGPAAGLIAGATLALTPVAVLMFRFNNPDALMTLLCVVAAYCVIRALENASTKWLIYTGLAMGFAFLAKSLQPMTILPALALAYLVAAPTSWWRRIWQLLAGGVALVVGAGWWVAIATLWPASSRPYFGGSGDNTPLGLAFGYNGLGRITGNESTGGGFGGGGGGGANFSGTTGLGRLFNSEMGTQIAWLIPAALIMFVAGLWLTRRAPLTDRLRASMIIWGGWLIVTGIVLSYAKGTVHSYYTVELAPAIGALVGIGAVVLWRRRSDLNAQVALAASLLVTAFTAYTFLSRSTWHPELRWIIVALSLVAAAALFVPGRMLARAALVVPAAGLVAGLGATGAYALDTASTAHTGSTPSAGPASANGGFGGFGGFGGRTGRTGQFPGGFGGGTGEFPGGFGGFGGGTGTAPGGGTGTAPGGATGTAPGGGTGTAPGGGTGTAPGGSTGTGTRVGGAGGFGGQTANAALVALLKNTNTRWAAATTGSMTAGPLELASNKAVMAIGGFTGSDPAPTLAQFQAYVAKGEIHYYISGGGFGGRGGGSSSIETWVAAHYTSTTVGGSTVYDLTKATS